MSKHKSRDEWAAIIEAAARSGLKVSDFCRQNNISKNLFYRNSLRLGYTSEGGRTEKWFAAASAESQGSSLSDYPALVPVPLQTVQMAWQPAGLTCRQSQISILHDSFRIVVEDGFSQDTLRGVLEVMRDA